MQWIEHLGLRAHSAGSAPGRTGRGAPRRPAWTPGLALAWALALVSPLAAAQTPTGAGLDMAERTRACTACHGEQGRAGPDGYYPRLAGKPAGYLFHQLQNFASGRRQYPLMTRLIEPLDEAYLREMAAHFASQQVPYPPPSAQVRPSPAQTERARQLVLKGDAARGLPACVQCHGAQLTGVQPDVPGLVGLPQDYLNAQLGAWQTGQRRAHAPDCMKAVVARLAPGDIAALSAWLASQRVPANAHPAARPEQPPNDEAWRCGSAPGLRAGARP